MKDKVGYGIIGCGVIAPWHARAFKNIPDAKLACIFHGKVRPAGQTLSRDHAY